jgi:hypothetical protein
VVVIPEPARSDRRGVAMGIALVVVLAIGVGIVSLDGSATRARSGAELAVDTHGTRPPPLDPDAITRAATGFGITRAPQRRDTGWEAEDRVRSLYLTESPSAWYVLYENSSVLLGPLADREEVCSDPKAPADCAVPGITFLAETMARPPDAATAARAARRMLTRAGMLDGFWHVRVLDASTDVPPCRAGLPTAVDCTRQRIPTRAVMLTRGFGPGTTAARWGVIVGPRGIVLSVTGRYAEAA